MLGFPAKPRLSTVASLRITGVEHKTEVLHYMVGASGCNELKINWSASDVEWATYLFGGMKQWYSRTVCIYILDGNFRWNFAQEYSDI